MVESISMVYKPVTLTVMYRPTKLLSTYTSFSRLSPLTFYLWRFLFPPPSHSFPLLLSLTLKVFLPPLSIF